MLEISETVNLKEHPVTFINFQTIFSQCACIFSSSFLVVVL